MIQVGKELMPSLKWEHKERQTPPKMNQALIEARLHNFVGASTEFQMWIKTRAMLNSKFSRSVDVDHRETPPRRLRRRAHCLSRLLNTSLYSPSRPRSLCRSPPRRNHAPSSTSLPHLPQLSTCNPASMAATARAFTIFRDHFEAPVAEEGPTTTIAVTPSGPLLVYVADKENHDPLTGCRALSEQVLGKKRKNTLAAKTQPVSPSKKPRPLGEKTKKLISSSSKPVSDKKTKRSGASKRSTSKRTRREPSLPRLAEEGEEVEAFDQIAIDAKCKELTVLPLADISEAYEQAAMSEDLLARVQKIAEEKVRVVPRRTPPLADVVLLRRFSSRKTRSSGRPLLTSLPRRLTSRLRLPPRSPGPFSRPPSASGSTPRSRSRRPRRQASATPPLADRASSASPTSSSRLPSCLRPPHPIASASTTFPCSLHAFRQPTCAIHPHTSHLRYP